MKLISVIISFLPIVLMAQDKSNPDLFDFQSASGGMYSSSCGEITPDGWLVAKNSCNFYTVNTVIPKGMNDKAAAIIVRSDIRNSGNLNARDFAWLFYYIDNNVVKSVTLRGDLIPDGTEVIDTLYADAGSTIRMRISFVCDEDDEFWILPEGGLKFTLLTNSDNISDTEPDDVSEKLISAVYEDGVSTVSWNCSDQDHNRYYKVERKTKGSEFEFVAYVNKGIPKKGIIIYSLTDHLQFRTGIIYRVSEYTENGIFIRRIEDVILQNPR